MKQPDVCIVRITNAEGNTLGTGFLVSTDGRIATCAHVVEGTDPHVAFPSGEPRPALVVATNPTHDVAILRLEGELPPGAEPARLGRSAEGHYNDFRSRGYRPLGEMQGIPAEGRVLHAVSKCPGAKYMPLILKSQHIRQGMSGAPIYIPDLDLVVGMITGYWDSMKAETGFRDAETGFAVPSEAIAVLCPEIRIHAPRPESRQLPFGAPFQAPAVPRYFVPRLEVANDLKAHLLTDEATTPGALVVSAVHGLGGIGKTTLVASLAHDPELQARFPDGVLWATLGHQPDVLSSLHDWLQALGDFRFHSTTVEGASAHLRTLLHDKAALLVIDDAWQPDHVRPFLPGGERCRVLITTRDETLARKVGAHLYNLDVMTETQALALFDAYLGPLGEYRQHAATAARELDYLPLALELAAAQIGHDLSWSELRGILRSTLTELASLDLDPETYRNRAQRIFFRLSLERLPADDQEAFRWLGVLPEDVNFTTSMAAILWHQPDPKSVRQRLRHLRERRLIRCIDRDLYVIHDLLHDEARMWLTQQIALPQAHAALLARYRAHTSNEMWHTLPDDGYIHEHLTWHMQQAGQIEAVHALLQEETEEGANGWHQAREQLGQIAGYIADLTHAWRLAEEEFARHPSALSIARQCRYALIASSLGSLAGNIPLTLLTTLVKAGMWTPAQGLACARQMPSSRRRALALCAMGTYLSTSQRDQVLGEALAAARRAEKPADRAKTLADLIAHLPTSVQDEIMSEVLLIVTALEDPEDQYWTLAELAPALPAIQKARLMEFVLAEVQHPRYPPWWQALILAQMAPHLPDSLMPGAFEFAQTAVAQGDEPRDMDWKSECMSNLACRLAELGDAEQAVAVVKELPNEFPYARLCPLRDIVPYLTRPRQDEIVRELLALSRGILDPKWWVLHWSKLVHLKSLPMTLLSGAYMGLTSVLSTRWRRLVWGERIARLPVEAQAVVLQASLKALHPYADHGPLTQLLTWVPYTDGPDLDELLQAAFEVVQATQGSEKQVEGLGRLAPHLLKSEQSETLLQRALGITRTVGDTRDRIRAEAGMAPFLSKEQRDEAMQKLLSILPELDSEWRARALSEMAPGLPNSLIRMAKALRTAEAIRLHRPKLEAVSALTLTFATRRSLLLKVSLRRTLTLAGVSWPTRDDGFSALIQLAPHLAKEQRVRVLQTALTLARWLPDADDRCRALAQVAPYLSQPLQLEVCTEALASAGLIKDIGDRCRALVEIRKALPPVLQDEALQMALATIHQLQERMPGNNQPVESLTGDQDLGWDQVCQTAIGTARCISDLNDRAYALIRPISSLDEPLRSFSVYLALAASRAVDSGLERSRLWAELVPYILELPSDNLYPIWKEILRFQVTRTRRDLYADLGALSPILSRLGGPDAIAYTFRAIEDVNRWWP